MYFNRRTKDQIRQISIAQLNGHLYCYYFVMLSLLPIYILRDKQKFYHGEHGGHGKQKEGRGEEQKRRTEEKNRFLKDFSLISFLFLASVFSVTSVVKFC